MPAWMSLWSLGSDLSPADFRAIHALGFEGVEVWAEHGGSDKHLQWAVEAGLAVGLHLPFHDLNLATPDPVVADHVMHVQLGWLARLAAVGGRHAVLHGGYAWAAEDRRGAVERATERLRELGQLANRQGVRLLLENLCPDKLGYTHWVASTMDEWLDLLKATGASACLDIGHLAVMGTELSLALKQLGSRLQSIHYADNRREADEHLWPGDGSGITRGVWDTVDRMGYEGPVIYEINPYIYLREDLLGRIKQGLKQ